MEVDLSRCHLRDPDRSTFRETGDTAHDPANFVGTHEKVLEDAEVEYRAIVRRYNFWTERDQINIASHLFEDHAHYVGYRYDMEVGPFLEEGLSLASLCRAHHYARPYLKGGFERPEAWGMTEDDIRDIHDQLVLARSGSIEDIGPVPGRR